MIDLEINDIAYLSSKHKRDAARTAILQTRQALEHATEEVDNYPEKFRDAVTDTEKPLDKNYQLNYNFQKDNLNGIKYFFVNWS